VGYLIQVAWFNENMLETMV